MLPSMPILFARDSQDAFGNKVEPSTSYFNRETICKDTVSRQVEEPKLVIINTEEIKETNPNVPVNTDKQKEEPIIIDEDTYENALVTAYFNKIATRFGSTSTKFIQFRELLKTFDSDKETPVDLYRNIEALFGEENSDLVEEFLLFLTPSQAVEIGRFTDHLIMDRMTKFLHLLKTTFSRKPTVLRKIMQAITHCMKCDNISEMRRKVLPLLRSSPRLTDTFRVLFPDEPIPDSLYENNTDVMSENFLTDDKGYDVWEFEDQPDSRKNLCDKKDIDTKYMQGRVFLQYRKVVKASRVTYPYSKEPYRVHIQRLTPSHCRLSPTLSDEVSKQKPRSKRARKATLVKDVNDNNKQTVESSKVSKAGRKKVKSEVKLEHKSKKDSVPKCKKQKLDIVSKCKTDKTKVINIVSKDGKKDDMLKPKKVKFHLKSDKGPQNHDGENGDNKWTRDEDKVMLQILQGEARSDALFCKIRKVLPHRSMSDIKERFLYVINLVQQMSGNDVT